MTCQELLEAAYAADDAARAARAAADAAIVAARAAVSARSQAALGRDAAWAAWKASAMESRKFTGLAARAAEQAAVEPLPEIEGSMRAMNRLYRESLAQATAWRTPRSA